MNPNTFRILFLLGATVPAWVAVGFAGGHWLALAITLLIGAVYSLGARELHRMHQASVTLDQALQRLPGARAELEPWLAGLHPTLQNPVRLRLAGERAALPGPALTPYLVGLLVMLGMLGTFLGMVLTLDGAVFALEGTPDLQAIRSAFAAPIRGLGLAFGTSVAGVASSAALGLLSALVRRARAHGSQRLDGCLAGPLHVFTHAHQREQAFAALQAQAQALPQVLQQLQAMAAQMQRTGEQVQQDLQERQQHMQQELRVAYTSLAQSVDHSLQQSLAHSAQAASASLRPLLQQTLQGLADEGRQLQQGLLERTQAQLLQLQTQAQELHASRQQAEHVWRQDMAQHTAQLATLLREELGALRAQEAQRAQAATDRLATLQEAVAGHLAALGTALEAPLARLIDTASDAPRAASELLRQLRQEVAQSTARDNVLLEERSRILQTLNGLLDDIQHASDRQRTVIEALVTSSAATLEQAGARFDQQVQTQATQLDGLAADLRSSAVDVASLGEAFGFAVQSFNTSNATLVSHLQHIEAALDKSLQRSDEQLGYYVAQAREVIDLSIGAQHDMVQELRRLTQRQAARAGEAA